jgi:hypothetical protein
MDYTTLTPPQTHGTAQSTNDFDWKMLWDQPCAPKTKQFLWRLAHNSLPWKCNIRRRGMDLDTLCPMCKRLDEDGGHLFLRSKPVSRLKDCGDKWGLRRHD